MDQEQRDALSHRIRSLLNKTVANGCTEGEAILAAQKARQLMDQHRLSMTDIEFKEEGVVDFTIERKRKTQTDAPDYCFKGISKYCGVRMWRHTSRRVNGTRVLGLKSDAKMAKWLYEMIANAIDAEGATYIKELRRLDYTTAEKKAAMTSFGLGIAQRVNERLLEMAEALEPVAKTANGTAVAVIQNQLVNEAFAKLGITFRTIAGLGNRDRAAYGSGRSAGDRVNLNRPVGANPSAPRLR